MTGVDRAATEARLALHRNVENPWWTDGATVTDTFGPTECERCARPWPCDVAIARAERDVVRQQLAAVEAIVDRSGAWMQANGHGNVVADLRAALAAAVPVQPEPQEAKP